MNKIKIFFILVFIFILYKGSMAFKNFKSGAENRAVEIKVKSGMDVDGEVIALMMYIGNPLQLKEHLYVPSRSGCLDLKEKAKKSSSAFYKCSKVNAKITGGKIVKIIEELEEIK
tara:strand:+ start:120 stop:464 length:345 start_codon:yes stop_codon:yes gene_type:complete